MLPFITDAYAQTATPAAQQPSWMPMVILTAMMLVMYALLIRPQAKKQREQKAMNEALAKGDEVVTSGGLIGRITELTPQYMTLQVGSAGDKPVTITVLRSSVQTLLPKGTMKSLN